MFVSFYAPATGNSMSSCLWRSSCIKSVPVQPDTWQQHSIRLHFHCQMYQTNISAVLALNRSCGFVDRPEVNQKPGDSVQREAADTKKGNHGCKHLQSLVSVQVWGADVHRTGREGSSSGAQLCVCPPTPIFNCRVLYHYLKQMTLFLTFSWLYYCNAPPFIRL